MLHVPIRTRQLPDLDPEHRAIPLEQADAKVRELILATAALEEDPAHISAIGHLTLANHPLRPHVLSRRRAPWWVQEPRRLGRALSWRPGRTLAMAHDGGDERGDGDEEHAAA